MGKNCETLSDLNSACDIFYYGCEIFYWLLFLLCDVGFPVVC